VGVGANVLFTQAVMIFVAIIVVIIITAIISFVRRRFLTELMQRLVAVHPCVVTEGAFGIPTINVRGFAIIIAVIITVGSSKS